MKLPASVSRTLLGLVGAAAITVTAVAPSLAADSVTQVINGNGSLTASVANASMTAINYSNTQVTTTGSLGLSVSDPRGTAEGWHVTVASSDFDYQGTSTIGQDIPNAGFAVGTPAGPVAVTGQPVVSAGPLAVAGGSLDSARETIEAGTGAGSGQYTQALPVSLVVPAYSQVGIYVATLTVSITSGP